MHRTGLVVGMLCLVAVTTSGQSEACSGRTHKLTSYLPNIETHPRLSAVRSGTLVEFMPASLKNPAAYLRDVSSRGGVGEWYWVGANCNRGSDCAPLTKARVPLGSTGTAEWNKSELRIDDLGHPKVLERAEREMERALAAAALAGADLVFRIDNMHDLDDDRFYDRRHLRPFEGMKAVVDTWARIVQRFRSNGRLKPQQSVGLSAHNNFKFWRRYIDEGGTPPALLRIENPTQFPAEFDRGSALMRDKQLPLIAVEFRKGHGYTLNLEQAAKLASASSLLLIMPDENHYTGGEVRPGSGPIDLWPCANASRAR